MRFVPKNYINLEDRMENAVGEIKHSGFNVSTIPLVQTLVQFCNN